MILKKKTMLVSVGGLALATTAVLWAKEQELQSWSGWLVNDVERPLPERVEPAQQLGEAPGDAVILFDGSDLDHWTAEQSDWFVTEDGVMRGAQEGASDLVTQEAFGDCQFHVEWRIPHSTVVNGQQGGNSGVFFGGQYEVQIMDAGENHTTYADGMAGAVYGQQPPLADAGYPQGEWNAMDVVYRAPRFSEEGEVLDPGLVTVFLNGVCVQHGWALKGETTWRSAPSFHPHEVEQPIRIQYHGKRDEIIEFRNVWVREMPNYGDDFPQQAGE